MNRPSGPLFLSLACAVATAACSDASGPPPGPSSGTLSVTISGALSDQYEARGARPVSPAPGPATFASAIAGGPGTAAYLVSGFRARGTDRQDMLALDVRGATGPGEYPAAGNIALGITRTTGFPERTYRIAEGTVRVTALSGTRIAGEFSGLAIGGTFPITFPPFAIDTIYLAAGTFDVPIIRR